MKKFFTLVLSILIVCTIVGCSAKSESNKPILVFTEKAVTEIQISTLGANYQRTISSSEEILKIVNYVNGMSLTSDFPEDPSEYSGMTIVMQFCLDDGSVLNIYSFGNMFLKVNDGSWFRVKYDEANALGEMVLQ